MVCALVDGCSWQRVLFRETDLFWGRLTLKWYVSRIQKGPTHPFERVESRRWTKWRKRERKIEWERERERTKDVFVRRGRNVRECDQCEISTCVFHSFAILSVHSTLERQVSLTPPSSTRPFLRLYPVRDERTLSPSLLETVTPWLMGSEPGPPLPPLSTLLFCKVLFFRNAGPTIVFPRVFAHPYRRFLQSGRVIQRLLHGRLSPPSIFRTLSTSRQIGKCAPSRIHHESGIYSRGSVYRRPTNFARSCDAEDTCWKKSSLHWTDTRNFLRSIGGSCRAYMLPPKEKEEKKTLYFLDLKSLSFYLALEILYDGCSVNSLEFVHVQDVRSSAIASFNVRIQEAGNLAARLLVGFFAREGNFPFG